MDKEQKENLEKLRTLSDWICGDSDAAFYEIQAQFLVALVIFNYIEMFGIFSAGWPKKNREEQRFDDFFSRLGPEYKKLIDEGYKVYNDLRSGLTHQFIPKKYKFSIGHCGRWEGWHKKDEKEREKIRSKIVKEVKDKHRTDCGVKFCNDGTLLIFVSILLYDFTHAVKNLIKDIEEEKKPEFQNFCKAANKINFKNFIIH